MTRRILKTLLLTIPLILVHIACKAQLADNFEGILKINQVIEYEDSPATLISVFGQPNNTETVYWEMDGITATYYHYEDGEFHFVDNKLMSFKISSSNFKLTLGSFELKVGNHIDTISSTFPNSYTNRGPGGTAIILGPVDSAEYLNIKTDSNGLITEIDHRVS
jgi:hypothetical protein